jgi:hypothetical protein
MKKYVLWVFLVIGLFASSCTQVTEITKIVEVPVYVSEGQMHKAFVSKSTTLVCTTTSEFINPRARVGWHSFNEAAANEQVASLSRLGYGLTLTKQESLTPFCSTASTFNRTWTFEGREYGLNIGLFYGAPSDVGTQNISPKGGGLQTVWFIEDITNKG